MLIDRRNFWKLHGWWCAATVLLSCAAIAATVILSRHSGRWPGGGSSATGLAFGVIAAVIFLFEVALLAKKTRTFRTARWTLSAQTWMKAHIWLGLLTVPLVVLHSGGILGGTLTTLFVFVFAVVIASGLWGLVLQNWLPRLILEAAPAETVYSQIDRVGRQYADEARRLVTLFCGGASESPMQTAHAEFALAAHGAPRRVGTQIERLPHPARERDKSIASPVIEDALRREIAPYLEGARSTASHLSTRQRNQWYFDDLRLRVAPELRTLVGQLEELCERRRQLNVQRRLHSWLHNWLWLHLPFSIMLLALLAAHIVLALRFG